MALTGRQGAVAGPRRRPGGRGAGLAGGALMAASGALRLLARLVTVLAMLVAAIIVLAIVLRVLDASASNAIVKAIHDVGKTLVGPFGTVFKIHDPKGAMAANWGLAAAVYLIVGMLIAGLLRRLAPGRLAR